MVNDPSRLNRSPMTGPSPIPAKSAAELCDAASVCRPSTAWVVTRLVMPRKASVSPAAKTHRAVARSTSECAPIWATNDAAANVMPSTALVDWRIRCASHATAGRHDSAPRVYATASRPRSAPEAPNDRSANRGSVGIVIPRPRYSAPVAAPSHANPDPPAGRPTLPSDGSPSTDVTSPTFALASARPAVSLRRAPRTRRPDDRALRSTVE